MLRALINGRKVIVNRDMNARVSNECVGEVMGKWGVPGWNESLSMACGCSTCMC